MYIKKILLAIVLIGLVIASVVAYNIYGMLFAPNTAFNNEEAHLYIPSDASYEEVRAQLQPLLKNMDDFDAVAKRKGYVNNVKGGHYIIRKDMDNNTIINTIRSKNVPVKVSFNNQERIEDLAGRVATQIEADSVSLVQLMTEEDFLREQGLDQETALSLYIPNQYEFFWDTSAQEFRARMVKEHQKFWNDTRLKKAEQLELSPEEVYTLASIVQKESAKVDERPRVAGVYLNRLKSGWKLDADPTVIYALKKDQADWNLIIKRVLYKDLELDSPYNTYKNAGLPPGPIFMPDISAIDAVLNAEDHQFYFFVADVENFGYHKFARTLAEHNANKRDYVRWINQQGINR
ncbi:endolytic transglycosylase MltG [Croceiramulus getboli]|nr:endolytic transglycosylase MltG [Flavobacteriaceae bacterium YJPT1-3]